MASWRNPAWPLAVSLALLGLFSASAIPQSEGASPRAMQGSAAAATVGAGELDLHLFDESTVEAYGARCLDGSPAGYYTALNASSTQWVFYLEGYVPRIIHGMLACWLIFVRHHVPAVESLPPNSLASTPMCRVPFPCSSTHWP